MNINDYYMAEHEKPLDRIVPDGGFCGIFRRICCIGDSLSSGEFEIVDDDGKHSYYDIYEQSWGQYISRMTGAEVYNFSRGGMTAKEYCESFADTNGFWSYRKSAQAYIIALGVNDLFGLNESIGLIEDINFSDYTCNKDTFAGWYGMILSRVREISPDSILFLMTMPREETDSTECTEKKKAHAKLLHELADVIENTYVIDLYQYAPVYDKKFKDNFYCSGHMNAMGYFLTAKMVASYIDFIIRNNPEDFRKAGLIGTGIL